MILIVGLGNPGEKYINTWHNLGRLAVAEWQSHAGFPDFRLDKKANSFISKGNLEGKQMILALPETFMNNSGRAVKSLAGKYKVKKENIWVIHDDIDIPIGKIKIVKNRGSAGHKGIDSIVKELKTKNFIRFRIGIQPKGGKPKQAESFVLKKDTKNTESIKVVVESIRTALEKNLATAMKEFNK